MCLHMSVHDTNRDSHDPDQPSAHESPAHGIHQALRPAAQWHLKYAVTLQSPWATTHKQAAAIVVSHPFRHTLIGVLPSLAAWCQAAILSGCTRELRFYAYCTLPCPHIVGRTSWDLALA